MADGAVTIEIKGDSKDFEVNISNTAKKVNGLKSALHGAKSGESDLAGGAKKAAGELGGLKSVLKGIGTAAVAAFSVRAIASTWAAPWPKCRMSSTSPLVPWAARWRLLPRIPSPALG